MAGVTGLRYSFGRNDSADSPLFERQMGSEDFAEYQQMRQIADNLQQRVTKLERINTDLESRLEDQAKQSMAVEKESMSIERKWQAQCEALESEIGKWKAEFQAEKSKGDRLREQLSRTERELYGILQRKYELMRGPGRNGAKPPPSEYTSLKRDNSWDEINSTNRSKETRKVREKKALTNLSDFLGF